MQRSHVSQDMTGTDYSNSANSASVPAVSWRVGAVFRRGSKACLAQLRHFFVSYYNEPHEAHLWGKIRPRRPVLRSLGEGDLSSEALAKEEALDAEFLVYEGSTSTAGTFVVSGDEAELASSKSPQPTCAATSA